MSCRVELVQLDRARAELDRRGVDVVAVSFEPIEDLSAFRSKERLGIGLASDPGQGLGKALALVHENARPGRDAFYPTKVLIDGEGRVLWTWAEDDLRVRQGPATIVEAIDGVLPARK